MYAMLEPAHGPIRCFVILAIMLRIRNPNLSDILLKYAVTWAIHLFPLRLFRTIPIYWD